MLQLVVEDLKRFRFPQPNKCKPISFVFSSNNINFVYFNECCGYSYCWESMYPHNIFISSHKACKHAYSFM